MKLAQTELIQYQAAGGVVLSRDEEKVLLLVRASQDEVRLPKGHVEAGESLAATALREVREESGYGKLRILAELGEQEVTFSFGSRSVHRTEHYFLMQLVEGRSEQSQQGEEQFSPCWATWSEALNRLTFEAEREWIRRARDYLQAERRE